MDYKERYNAALERAKERYSACSAPALLEYIFPELKVSDDERIRKVLVGYFKSYKEVGTVGAETFNGIPTVNILAWLEKQEPIDKDKLAKGFLRSVANTIMQYLDANTAEGKMCLSNMECEDIENAVLNADWAKVYRYMKKKLEKQDENKVYTFKSIPRLLDMIEPTSKAKVYCQKLIDTLVKEGYAADAKIVSDCLKQMNGEKVAMATMDEKQGEPYGQRKECEDCQFNYVGECKGYCALKRNERKPTDKVEPKFNVGDWIISNDGTHTYLVKERKRGIYVLLDIGDGVEFNIVIETADKTGRLWSIYDAKDGDVLACSEEILLFKSYSMQGRISLYCWYNGQTNNFHSKEVDDTSLTTRNKIYPATKEQRDLLFQKMADAGYEFVNGHITRF